MSDDLNKKIKQITDILGQENMPDNVKGLLSLLGSAGSGSKEESQPKDNLQENIKGLLSLLAGSGGGSKDESAEKDNISVALKAPAQERSPMEENLDMIRKVKKVMDKVNTNNDPRINLLHAISPFLNNSRRKRLDNCVKILRMSSLTKFLDDNDK